MTLKADHLEEEVEAEQEEELEVKEEEVRILIYIGLWALTRVYLIPVEEAEEMKT